LSLATLCPDLVLYNTNKKSLGVFWDSVIAYSRILIWPRPPSLILLG
jgi:hypothetical protein